MQAPFSDKSFCWLESDPPSQIAGKGQRMLRRCSHCLEIIQRRISRRYFQYVKCHRFGIRSLSTSTADNDYGGSISGSNGSILFLSPTLWPEPSSSAAGVRTSCLLRHFAAQPKQKSKSDSSIFTSVHYGSGAPKPQSLVEYSHLHNLSTEYGIKLHNIPANRSDEIEDILTSPKEDGEGLTDLSAVVFDRYFAEEAYSFHLKRKTPNVLRILDMQDFHSLRLARQTLVDNCDASSMQGGQEPWMDDLLMDTLMECIPSHYYATEDPTITQTKKNSKKKKCYRDGLLRELASIHRSDLTLVCSSHEFDILTNIFGIDPAKLCMAPFFASEHTPAYDSPACQYENRSDFMMLGGFRHPPNIDSVKWLKAEVWPRIRSQMPDAKVHIWGSYPPQHIAGLNDAKAGILVNGRLDYLAEELSQRRILLAPLRYGAGIKGKAIDAWENGCPVVTTPIGAEGTTVTRDILTSCTVRSGDEDVDDVGWGGLIGTDADALARCAVRLYQDQGLWDEARDNARRLLRVLFDEEKNLNIVSNAIVDAMNNKDKLRAQDHIGAIMWHQNLRSTEYFSRWIELKEKSR